MDSQDQSSSKRSDVIQKLLMAAFARAASGEPGRGRSPEELMDLIQERLERTRAMQLSPEREAELRGMVEELGLTADADTPAAIRRLNGMMAERELEDGGKKVDPKFFGTRYKADPENGAPPPAP